LHLSGRRYRWAIRAPVAPLPGLLRDAFRRYARTTASETSEPSDAYVRAAVSGICADLSAAAGPGSHHWPLLRACFRFRDLGLIEDDALADLLPLVPLHDEREACRTIRSVFR
jgi:hypothetical protein